MTRDRTKGKLMDDHVLAELLRDLDRPVEPRRPFADQLYVVLRREAVRPQRTNLYMLAAAALVVTAVIGLTIAGAGALLRRNDGLAVVQPSPASTMVPASSAGLTSTAPRSVGPSPFPTAALTPQPIPSFVETEMLQLDGQVTIGANDNAVWLGQSASDGATATLMRVDASDQSVTRFPVSPDRTASSVALDVPVVGESYVWVLTYTETGQTGRVRLFTTDGSLSANVFLPDSYHALGVDEFGRLWGAVWPSTISAFTDDGQVASTVEITWVSTGMNGWRASLAPAPAFGSLWAHELAIPTVDRLDPVTAEIQATIELSHCGAAGPNHFPRSGLTYPIRGVDGLPDAMVVSCSYGDNPDAYNGPMALIDPSTNAVLGLVDPGGRYGRGAVLDGRWYVPVLNAAGDGGYVAVIDIASLRSQATLATYRGWNPDGLVATGDSLWLIATDEAGAKHLVRLQPQGQE